MPAASAALTVAATCASEKSAGIESTAPVILRPRKSVAYESRTVRKRTATSCAVSVVGVPLIATVNAGSPFELTTGAELHGCLTDLTSS